MQTFFLDTLLGAPATHVGTQQQFLSLITQQHCLGQTNAGKYSKGLGLL